jgi:hypothetical protein
MKKYLFILCLLFTGISNAQNANLKVPKILQNVIRTDSLKVCVLLTDTLYTEHFNTLIINTKDSGYSFYYDKFGIVVYQPKFDAGPNGRGIIAHKIPDKKAIEFERKMKKIVILDKRKDLDLLEPVVKYYTEKSSGLQIPLSVMYAVSLKSLDTIKACVFKADTLYAISKKNSFFVNISDSGMQTYYNSNGIVIFKPNFPEGCKTCRYNRPQKPQPNRDAILFERKMKVLGILVYKQN